MKDKLIKLIGFTLVLVALFYVLEKCSGVNFSGRGGYQRSESEQLTFWQRKFYEHFETVQQKGEGIWVVSNGYFMIDPGGQYFVEGDTFAGQPDEHFSSKFEILKIVQDGIIIEYYSEFDHSSFGTDLVTKDSGSLKVYWKE